MQALFNLSDFIFSGYTLTAIPLLLAYLFIKTKRPLLSRVMVWSNWILVVGSCVYLASTLIYIFILLDVGDKATISINRLIGPFWFGFWGLVVFKGFLPQMLWFKKFRNAIWIMPVLLPFILFDHYFEFLIRLILNLNRDYVPSSWVLYPPKLSEFVLSTLIYTFILVVCYFIDRIRRIV